MIHPLGVLGESADQVLFTRNIALYILCLLSIGLNVNSLELGEFILKHMLADSLGKLFAWTLKFKRDR